MFKRILCPLALSETEDQVVKCAVELAAPSGGTVFLLHVIETIRGAVDEELSEFYNSLEHKAQEGINRAAAHAAQRTVECRKSIVFGDRVEEILRQAAEVDCDLIVLGSHRINPQQPSRGWGTVSYKVGILSQCPVLLVK